MMRKMTGFFLLIVLLCTVVGAAPATGEIAVTVLGKPVAWTDARPFIQDGRTMVPLRAVGEAMGLRVDWDAAGRCATFTKTYTKETSPEVYPKALGEAEYISRIELKLYEGQRDCYATNTYFLWPMDGSAPGEFANGSSTRAPAQMDVPLLLKNGRVYAPLRYLAETFYQDAAWDGQTRTAAVVPYLPPQRAHALTVVDGRVAIGVWAGENVRELTISTLEVVAQFGMTQDAPWHDAPQAVYQALAGKAEGFEGPPTWAVLLDNPLTPLDENQTYSLWYRALAIKTNGAEQTLVGEFIYNPA